MSRIPTNRHQLLALNHGPVANYLQHPAHEDTPKAKSILVKADQVADEVGLDDEVMDGLVVKSPAIRRFKKPAPNVVRAS
jgi:hypothetical protein